MNAYQLGLLTPARPRVPTGHYRAGTAVGLRLGNFPGYILDEMERLNGEVQTADADFRATLDGRSCAYVHSVNTWADPITTDEESHNAADRTAMANNGENCRAVAEFYSGPWATFTSQWADFYHSHNSGGVTGWVERFWGGSMGETLDAYRAQLVGMRDSAKRLGFDVVSPNPVAPAKGYGDRIADAPGGLFDFLKLVVYLLVGAAGALLLGLLFKGGSVGKLLVVKG